MDITSEDGKVNIYIPKGTYCLDEEGNRLRKLVIEVAEEAPEIPGGYFLLGNAYDLSPDGATFDPYLRLTLAYEEEDIPEEIEEKNLYIAYYSDEWVPLDSTVDTGENEVSADVTHFTAFAIMAKAPPPPAPAPTPIPTPAPPPAPVEPGNWWLIGGIVAAVVIIGGAIAYYMRRRA